MTCEQIKPLFAEYWSGTLDAESSGAVEQHLAGCEKCRAEAARLEGLWRSLSQLPVEQPGESMRDRFYETLGAYRDGADYRWSPDGRKAAPSRPRPVAWFSRAAAGLALLVAGGAVGYNFRNNQAPVNEITQLRGEVSNMRQLVTLSLLQQQSASERLRGVSFAVRAEPSDTEVLDALVSAVNHDPNVNVRLAAVDALRPFAANQVARAALMQALPGQTEPLVQVALIDLLVDLKEKNAETELKRVALDGSTDSDVRQRAQWALARLQ